MTRTTIQDRTPLNLIALPREDAVMLVRFAMCPPQLQTAIREMIRHGSRGGGTGSGMRRIEPEAPIVLPTSDVLHA